MSFALSRVWTLPVEYDTRCEKYVVKVPYEVFLQAEVRQDISPQDPCSFGISCQRRIPGTASAQFARLFDLFTSGDEIYLVSSTSLIDGAEALGCAAEFCGMRPVTGQVSSGVPFPAIDTAFSGFVYTTSPAFGTATPWYGLHTIRLVILNRGDASDALLGEFWRGTGLEWRWQIRGSREQMNLLLPDRVREVHIYDVDGTVLRFLGRRAEGSEEWEYEPAFGVFAQLSGNEQNGFVLYGGPPGSMRAKGGWQYHFEAWTPDGGGDPGFQQYYAEVFCRQITDPLGNSIYMTGSGLSRTLYDPISGSTLQFSSNRVLYSHPRRRAQDLFSSLQVGSSALISEPEFNPEFPTYNEAVSYNTLSTGNQQLITLRTGGISSFPSEGSPILIETRGWSPFSQGENELLGYLTSGVDPSFQGMGRLTYRTWGDLIPFQYTYEWIDSTRFQIRTQRDAFLSKLTYLTDESTGKFLEATYVRPALNGQAEEKYVYHFDQERGQVNRVQYFSSTDNPHPKWETSYTFGDPSDPLAITQVEQRYPADNITRTWSFRYTERNGETLIQSVRDPTGVSAFAEYAHEDFPVLPSAVYDGVGNRWEMTYTGPGLLQSIKEPDRSPWLLSYYPQGHPFQNKLEQVTDPTGRSYRITQYDLFGRPTRVEMQVGNRLLYQQFEWTMMGAPRRISWSDGSSVSFYWHGPGLRGMEDARGRKVWFNYNLQPELGEAGLLNEIRFGVPGSDNPLQGALFASLRYDTLGRLVRVAGGNNVGVNYTYGIRDQLRFVRYDGDSNREEFTYSCCGELESWRRQDGRTAYFEYEGGLLKHIRLNNPLNPPAYTFGYDLAGRLKSAQSQTSRHQWIYEYEVGVNTSRLSQEQNQVYGAGISYTHAYTYYPSGEVQTAQLDVSLTQGGYQRTLTYWYDDAGRLTDIFYNGQQLASYSYDSAGRLQSQTVRPLGTNATLTTTLTYADAQSVGAIGKVEWRWNGQSLALFNYEGYNNQRGYYPDGTLARAQETLAGQPTRFWEWDYDEKGQLAYEKRREGNGSWSQTNFTYDAGGNLWGNGAWVYHYNQLVYAPQAEGNNGWYFNYTANGERFRRWTTNRGTALQGDVNRDGQVDDADLNAVLFAFGNSCSGCPEDLNGDGQVDDADLQVVLFNFGDSISSGGSLSWEYAYDIWGNLIEAHSPAAGTYRAGYDALGRRLWEEVQTAQGTRRTYFLYEGDTMIGEVSPEGVYEYVWGLLGPIARIDLQNPANTRYYVLDGLGHVRMLVSPGGNPTDVYHYDSWGTPIATWMESTRQPFRWNGMYGYEYVAFTGLYHVGAREYDPRVGRWLQRDPASIMGAPNFYSYALNDPINYLDIGGMQPEKRPPVVIYIHGSLAKDVPFTREYIEQSSRDLGATHTYTYKWISSRRPQGATANRYSIHGDECDAFMDFVQDIADKHPGQPIIVIAHSNGGNVAGAAAVNGSPISLLFRLGSPPDQAITPQSLQNTTVIDVYDPNDKVAGDRARNLAQLVGFQGTSQSGSNWYTLEVNAPASFWNTTPADIEKHINMTTLDVWKQITKS